MATFNIAAGHGASDSGATLGSRYEKNDNLKLSLATAKELARRGHKVNQFRVDDSVNCDWKSCRSWMDSTPADCSVVFHRNAFNGTATGVEVWSFNASDLSTKIATTMSANIATAAGFYNRGRKGNGAAWISPSVISVEPEVGFIDNVSDNDKFDNNFDSIVNAVCNTLESYFGTATPIQPAKPAEGVIAYGTTTNYLNIRSAPVTGEIKTSMPTGSVCEIYSIDNNWANIAWNGYTGYASVEYMTVQYVEQPKDEEPSDEVIAYGITTNYLNIRKTPVSGDIITSMPTGSKCNIYSITDGWAYLDYNGTKGYSSTDYMTIEYIAKNDAAIEEPEQSKEEVSELYRVRKTWEDAKSQVGAYSNLNNAIEKAKLTGLNVFDSKGNLVWEYVESQTPTAPETPVTPEVPAEPVQPSEPEQPEEPSNASTDKPILDNKPAEEVKPSTPGVDSEPSDDKKQSLFTRIIQFIAELFKVIFKK